jgi:hypothetical protein
VNLFYVLSPIVYALLVAFTGKWLAQTSVPSASEPLQRRAVEDGGGTWVGYMEGLVYFNSPQTGSTLVLVVKDSEISADNVRRKIEESDAKFIHRNS